MCLLFAGALQSFRTVCVKLDGDEISGDSASCAEPTVSSPPETLEDTTTRSLRLNVSSVYECVCVCVCVFLY